MTESDEHKRNLRDLYAGLAMMGLVSGGGTTQKYRQGVPAIAYDLAEAMMQEREKRDQQ